MDNVRQLPAVSARDTPFISDMIEYFLPIAYVHPFMNIAILSFGYGYLEESEERYYKSYGNDVRKQERSGEWDVAAEGNYISGDSRVALSLCREFRALGHEANATHYENVEEASEEADLVLSLGIFGVKDKYQQFGDTNSIYWWWGRHPGKRDRTIEEAVAEDIVDSNFDAVLTSGKPANEALEGVIPSARAQIGYDRGKVECDDPSNEHDPEITYVGTGAIKDDSLLDLVLEPATEYDLEIYGSLWENSPYEEYFQGRLPRGDMGDLYANSTVVLGLHGYYVDWGMINDRVFDALGADAIFVDRYHEHLADEPFSEYINMAESKAEMETLLEDILNNTEKYQERANRGGEFVRNNYTYEHTVEKILDFYTETF